MNSFKLSKDSEEYQLLIDGNVHDSQNNFIGNWSTDDTNNIEITLDNSDKVVVPVSWAFDENNHFVIQQEGTVVFNFNEYNHPRFETKNAVLLIRPERIKKFQFEIRGEWDLTKEHKLSFTINNTQSIIDGYLADRYGRFIYHFHDKKSPWINGQLGFIGDWSQQTNNEGAPLLDFIYKREDGSTDVFSLPNNIIINTTTNQFEYNYNGEDGSYSLSLSGYLEITESFEIKYTLARQKSSNGEEMVGKTIFTIGVSLNKNNWTGNLDLLVKKEDGSTGEFILSIGGDFIGKLGEANVEVGFLFIQRKDGNEIIENVASLSGKVIFNDNKGHFEYSLNIDSVNKTVAFKLGSEINLRDGGKIGGKLTVEAERGKIKTITAMFKVRF